MQLPWTGFAIVVMMLNVKNEKTRGGGSKAKKRVTLMK